MPREYVDAYVRKQLEILKIEVKHNAAWLWTNIWVLCVVIVLLLCGFCAYRTNQKDVAAEISRAEVRARGDGYKSAWQVQEWEDDRINALDSRLRRLEPTPKPTPVPTPNPCLPIRSCREWIYHQYGYDWFWAPDCKCWLVK